MANEGDEIGGTTEENVEKEKLEALLAFVKKFDCDVPQNVNVDNIHCLRYDGSFKEVNEFNFIPTFVCQFGQFV